MRCGASAGLWIIAVLCARPASPADDAAPVDRDRQAVAETVLGVFRAAEAGQVDRLEAYHAFGPEFSKFDELGLGREDAATARLGERQGLSAARAFRASVQQLKVDLLDGGAVATFVLAYTAETPGGTVANRLRSTIVLARRAGSWKIVHEHFSPLRDAASADPGNVEPMRLRDEDQEARAPEPGRSTNAALLTAVTLAALLAAAHSYLGERYILTRLFRKDCVPRLFGDTTFTRATMRFAWHITSVAWVGLAALLVSRASPGSARAADVVALTFAASGLLALVGSRGRHLSWVVFFTIALLAWYGTR